MDVIKLFIEKQFKIFISIRYVYYYIKYLSIIKFGNRYLDIE